jgi:DnaJ-class molecular chaperone
MPSLQRLARGDHRVLVNVAIPAHLTEEQRRLLDEFARSEHDRNYGSEGGLFERLRSAFR